MKTLRYILLGILLITFIPVCNSQTPDKTKQIITLKSVPENDPSNLLSDSKEILWKRLGLMGLQDVRITQNNAKSELVVIVGDTPGTSALFVSRFHSTLWVGEES